ncbi:MAG TPA: cytochrome c, partial [Terracidiphilus sp.]|nr:cytochrome c [Terracidiphilus sp.]
QSGGADVYKAKCAMCHGADGAGTTPAGKALKAASFKDAAVISASDADLHAAVTNGKGKMPASQGKLTDAQIKAVIGYVRSLQK